MIDWGRVTELTEEIGQDGFADVVALFLEEVEGVLNRLQGAPDSSTLAEDLHFLKGSALNLGFRDLADLCRTGEGMAAAGQTRQVDLAHILASYDMSRQVFRAGLAQRQAG